MLEVEKLRKALWCRAFDVTRLGLRAYQTYEANQSHDRLDTARKIVYT